jgi:hypothetical protein
MTAPANMANAGTIQTSHAWAANILSGVEQAQAIGALAKQARPYAERIVAAEWADLPRDYIVSRREHDIVVCAGWIARDAYRTGKTVADVAAVQMPREVGV